MQDRLVSERAGLPRRLASLVYDSFLLFSIAIVYSAVFLVDLASDSRPLIEGLILGFDDASSYEPIFIGLYATLSSYYCICWTKKGQTLGMKSWRIKLQNTDGTAPTFRQCILRCLIAPFSLIFGGIGFIWCILPPNYSCLHDLATATEVVII
mgnify:CR=1 FL=1